MSFDDDFGNHNDSKVRRLIEQGDMGYRPGDKFPLVSGSSKEAQTVRATIGATFKDYQLHEQYMDTQRARAYPKIFEKKIRARRKIAFMKRIDARRYEITEVTFNDPHILPRLIKGDEFTNLYSGIAYANSRGVVFNVHITINWRDLGYGTGELAEASLYKSFIRKYTEWCRDNNLECIWIYSNESSDRVGLHTHFMTSIHKSWLPDFERYVTKLIRKINRADIMRPNAFKISVPKRSEVQRQWIRFQYLCKGMDQDARLKHANGFDSVYIHDLVRFGYESPGDVTCKKRCGISRNIDKKARDKAGFKSLMELGILNVDLLYSNDTLVPLPDNDLENILRDLDLI
jgi:hypothetical protein